MNFRWSAFACAVLLGSVVVVGDVLAQASRISYGRVTAVRQVDIQNPDARAAGAMVGGLAGLATGSGQSGSNRALRTIGGAAIGGRVAGAATRATGFEYTILVGGTRTVQIVTEKVLRVGDCVSVEMGQFNNVRLAPDERCNSPANAAPPPAAVSAADACAQATQQVLDAETDEEFERAERRMRLLCN